MSRNDFDIALQRGLEKHQKAYPESGVYRAVVVKLGIPGLPRRFTVFVEAEHFSQKLQYTVEVSRNFRIVTYIHSLMELDIRDIENFAKDVSDPMHHIVRLMPEEVPECNLWQGVVVVWEGSGDESRNEIRDAFLEEWRKDLAGEGPGR